jgi:hypothetical protein
VVAPVPPAALHPLTPGNPLYGMLKIGAIGALVGLRFVLVRRNKAQDADSGGEPDAVEVAPPVARAHPVSKKKKRRKRRA